MKNKRMLFIILGILIVSCNNGQNEDHDHQKQLEQSYKIVKKLFFEGYNDKYRTFVIDNQHVTGAFNEYFKNTNYLIVFADDMDGDTTNEYMGVIEYPGIYRGIKEALIVDEYGNIEMYIDREKGIYNANGEYYYDFKKTGYKKGEVECIRLIMSESDFRFTKKEFDELYLENKEHKKLYVQVDMWYFQLLDKDLKIITEYTNTNFALYNRISIMKESLPYERLLFFEMFEGVESDEEVLERLHDQLEQYRENKKKGLLFDPINFIP